MRDREPELKDRQMRSREDRNTRRLWWVCIVLLPEKTRSDGGDAVKTKRIRGDAVTVFVLGLPPWWNGDGGSVVEAPSESFDRSTVRFSFARRRTQEKGERGEKKLY
ncbi:hypothetical protein Bca52824_083300 [Brassica carinata]|uniref:Uncharacterized protein n=1 Tax=Brassica carinata TaxID=52824 RepID=A0A8X7PP39_BRACI|nr:hypothetical protein Bca52824_083300 [Brassica carinata]